MYRIAYRETPLTHHQPRFPSPTAPKHETSPPKNPIPFIRKHKHSPCVVSGAEYAQLDGEHRRAWLATLDTSADKHIVYCAVQARARLAILAFVRVAICSTPRRRPKTPHHHHRARTHSRIMCFIASWWLFTYILGASLVRAGCVCVCVFSLINHFGVEIFRLHPRHYWRNFQLSVVQWRPRAECAERARHTSLVRDPRTANINRCAAAAASSVRYGGLVFGQ